MLGPHSYDGASLTPKNRKKQRSCRMNADLTCGVCGLPAKNYHYGGAACQACKAFFWKAVIWETYSSFICEDGGHCTVSHVMRNKCSSCRFAKCVENGMNPKWVMNYKDRQKRREWLLIKRALRMDRMYDPDPRNLLELLTEDEMSTVHSMVRHFRHVSSLLSLQDVTQHICNAVDTRGHDVSLFALGALLGSRIVWFVTDLPEFSKLRPSNRNILIGKAMHQMTALRRTYEFDYRRNCWPNDKSYDQQHPTILNDRRTDRVSAASLRKIQAYAENIHQLGMDEPCILLLILITLFTTDNRPGLTETDEVEALQERFLTILCKYVRWKYGSLNSTVVFSKLLGLLTQSQDVCGGIMSEKNYWMESFEYEYAEKQLGSMNPFRGYSMERRNETFIPATVDPLGVLEDSTPTVDMIRRGAASIVQHEQTQLSKFFQEDSNDSSDLYSLIEELSDLQSPEECNSDNNNLLDTSNVDDGSGQSLSPWSPEEFDLSWCPDV